MKIDFHTHGRLTKKSKYDSQYFLAMVHAARESGLDSIVLSEHFNTDEYYFMYDALEEQFHYEEDYYAIDGVKVFMGLEVDVAEGGHVILINTRRAILAIRQGLDPYTEKSDFISADALLDLADRYDSIKIAAHPFRGPAHLGHRLTDTQLQRFDALDFNATDVFSRGRAVVANELEILAERLDLVIVTGSDSHYPVQMGSNWTQLEPNIERISDLRNIIREGFCTTHLSEILEMKVFAAKTTKAHLKQRLQLQNSEKSH